MEWKYQLGHILNEDEIDNLNKSDKTILELLKKCENSKELFNSVAKIINYNEQLYRIVISKINKHYTKPSK